MNGKLSIIHICRTNQKRNIHGQDRVKEEQILDLKFRVLQFVQIAKARFIRIQFVKNAVFIMANKF